MLNVFVFVLLSFGLVLGVPTNEERITGGSVVSIDRYPQIGVLLYTADGAIWRHGCGCSILNNRSLLTAAHCVHGSIRVRLGSAMGSSGGTVYIVNNQFLHPSYNPVTFDSDIAVLRVSTAIIYIPNAIRPASIAGSNYYLADNQVLWATGWGMTWAGSTFSEQLRHVEVRSINQAICRQRWLTSGVTLNDNMLCAGLLDVPGVGQCGGDSGSPLFHNGNVVGLCSFGASCGHSFLPVVNVRISRFTSWIINNA